jgi:hypothetical protein
MAEIVKNGDKSANRYLLKSPSKPTGKVRWSNRKITLPNNLLANQKDLISLNDQFVYYFLFAAKALRPKVSISILYILNV